MDIPTEILTSILGFAYYKFPDRRFNSPDHNVLRECALVHSSWKSIAQELLFRHITFVESRRLYENLLRVRSDEKHHQELFAQVRILEVHLQDDAGGGLEADKHGLSLTPTEFSTLLSKCSDTYELVISAHNIFLLDPGFKHAVHSSGLSIRSLNLTGCSVQSPVLFELLGLFPTIQFLAVGVEIVADPPTEPLKGIHLYELVLHRILPIETLQWLMASSKQSLRILELRDIPGLEFKTLLRDDFASNLLSLRLFHADRRTASFILPACTQLKELVCLNLPRMTRLERYLPATVETLSISGLYLGAIISIIEAHSHVKTLWVTEATANTGGFEMLRDLCATRNTRLEANLPPVWLVCPSSL